jgi:hypothetical protein
MPGRFRQSSQRRFPIHLWVTLKEVVVVDPQKSDVSSVAFQDSAKNRNVKQSSTSCADE